MNKAAAVHFLKKGGVSIPPLLLTLIWLCASFLVFPKQTPKTNSKNISSKPPQAKLVKAAGSTSSTKITDTQKGTHTLLIPTITPTITPQVVSDTNSATPFPTNQPTPTSAPSHQTVQSTPAPVLKDTINTTPQPPAGNGNTNNDHNPNTDHAKPPVLPLLQASSENLPHIQIQSPLSLPLISEK